MNNEITRRRFLKTTGISATALAFSKMTFSQPEMPQRPNMLLYVVDDHGTDDAGCYGNPIVKTPGLDLLAKEGVRFTNAFCTTASCSASRSVILTGLHNHANGQYGHAHAYHHFVSFSHVKSLPVLLGEAGYRTLAAGKYHVAPEEVYHFQNYITGKPSPPEMVEACRSFIAENADQPFFLYFCTNEPHRPFSRDGSDLIDTEEVIVPPYLPDTTECRAELARYYGSVQRADSGLLRLIQILRETDHWDDTVIIYISDNGIAFPGAKTTLYDPGMRLPCVVRNPFVTRKNMVNHAMISWADITPTLLDFAGVLETNVNQMKADSTTKVQWDEVIKPGNFHGRSFKNILDQENPTGWDEIYASHTFHEITMYYPMRVVRTRQYKLIWNIAHKLEYPFASDLWASETWQGILKSGDQYYGKRLIENFLHRPEFELYDLQADPLEVKNLADEPEYAQILMELKEKIKAFQKNTNDPWIVKWRHE